MAPPIIHRDDIGICRVGTKIDIEKESSVEDWPSILQPWIPSVCKYEAREDMSYRWEVYQGACHREPIELVYAWWEARRSLWKPQPQKKQTLRQWLKQIAPAHKIDAKKLWLSLRENQERLSFMPSRKDILRALDSSVSIVLHLGYVHGKLNHRRVREKGFICWRGAQKEGVRGADVAPFFLPQNQPKDVLIHILKWSWKYNPVRAFDTLVALGLLKQKVSKTCLSVTAHPALSSRALEIIMGCSSGMVYSKEAGVAQTRTNSMVIGGRPVHVYCDPPVSKRDDKFFFQPRNRSPEALFSLWKKGIKLDEEGRYSLTPEKMAMDIARRVPQGIVWDAFCGCGGNAIAFARQKHIHKVIASDIDINRLAMAKHNAKLYGVEHKIDFRCVDAQELVFDDVYIFADPPWGRGDEYLYDIRSFFFERFSHGMIKLPVHLTVADDARITLFCTDEGYPSFLIQHW